MSNSVCDECRPPRNAKGQFVKRTYLVYLPTEPDADELAPSNEEKEQEA